MSDTVTPTGLLGEHEKKTKEDTIRAANIIAFNAYQGMNRADRRKLKSEGMRVKVFGTNKPFVKPHNSKK